MTTHAAPAESREARASARPLRSEATILARVVRAPVTWLALLVGFSALARGLIGLAVASPWILPDEVVYSELAKSIAQGGRPSIRDVPVFGWGEVYPTLVAPAWLLFDDLFSAYRAALLLNALVMSLTAIPAYLLARLFVTRSLSFVVAVMTVLVPSMAYTGVVMTENACYPAFVLALLLLARVVRDPTFGRQALALLGLGVVVFTRIQSAALLGAYAGAVGIYALTASRAERGAYLRRFWPTAALVIPAAAAPFVLSVSRGEGLVGWLGARSGTFERFKAHEVPQWAVLLTADLILYLAVIPVAATAVMIGLGVSRTSAERLRLFAAIALPTYLAMLVSVAVVSASLDVDGTENLNERYLFYVVPLAFVGCALWVSSGHPRPRPWVWGILAASCLLTALMPIQQLAYNAGFQSLALLPWLSVSVSNEVLSLFVAAFTLGLGMLWLVCRPDRSGRLWLAVGAWLAIVGAVTVDSNLHSARNSAYAFEGRTATWIDDAVPAGSRVDVLWRRGPEGRPVPVEFWVMVGEFFNGSVGDVYRIGRPTYYETFLPTVPVRERAGRTLAEDDGKRVDPEYVLVSCRTPVVGEVVGRGPQGRLSVVKVSRPLRLASDGSGCGTD